MATTQQSPAPAARRYDLDWFRIAVVFMLIPYHSSRLFDTWEAFYVKNATTSLALTTLRALVDPWGMQLLFVIAGAAAGLALRRRSGAQYFAERIVRLIIPLAFGLVLLVPPQAYVAWLGAGHAGSYWQFFRHYWVFVPEGITGYTGNLYHLNNLGES